MAKYKAYPEYKDSGVEWLGEVPNHWKTVSISRLFSRVKRTGYKEKELLSVYRDYGVIPKSSRDDNNNKPSEDLSPYQLVQSNDLVMNKMKAWQGSIAISECEGIVSPAYFVYQPNNSLFELAHPKYVHYLLRNPIYVTQYLSRSKGIRVNQWDLDPDEFRNIEILLPSKVEQEKIYSFLDHETAKIDNLIEKQQQLIELLKEKRQAVISHAVTKGLNPDVPMKDSGVDWLGEVPEHWGITKLKWVGRTTSGGTPTTSKFEIYYEDGHIPWIRTTDLNNGELFDTPIRITSKAVNDTACSILPVGSVLLGMYGGAGSIGKHAILRFESTINQAVCGVLPCGRILPDFLHKYYEFYRPFWMIDAAGTRKDPNIGQDNIKEGIILIPPFEEQVEINNHIDNMRNIYECIIENALEGMDLLQERRTALISAAVTGKIDVRDWVAPETQDVEEPQEVTA
ncbi:restriction modification system DNA specificity domain-containing protein [Enterobacter cloacae]|nr:restriction endonuclease subunit S [Enterobacter cloacae]ELV2780282.1 restriction endonuclease subunit S [Enterobacter cloacae]VAX74500.1 restriction modification system DNA specificity domain-containing protein [Enterobacter cloacae]